MLSSSEIFQGRNMPVPRTVLGFLQLTNRQLSAVTEVTEPASSEGQASPIAHEIFPYDDYPLFCEGFASGVEEMRVTLKSLKKFIKTSNSLNKALKIPGLSREALNSFLEQWTKLSPKLREYSQRFKLGFDKAYIALLEDRLNNHLYYIKKINIILKDMSGRELNQGKLLKQKCISERAIIDVRSVQLEHLRRQGELLFKRACVLWDFCDELAREKTAVQTQVSPALAVVYHRRVNLTEICAARALSAQTPFQLNPRRKLGPSCLPDSSTQP
jgi:adenylate kinase family enzyme